MVDVLLIDDDNNEFKVFSDAVRQFPEPIRFIYADCAEHAYQILRNFQPYMILVKMDMPRVDGIECINGIVTIKKGATPIIVLYSAQMDNKLCQRAKDAGARDCFKKTPSNKILIEKLSPFLSTL